MRFQKQPRLATEPNRIFPLKCARYPQWFDPGRTRFPVRGGKHWLQVEDPERYPTITNDLLIELFYPTSTVKQRTVLATRARKGLDRLVKDGEARIVKGRLMPPKPRE